MSRFSQWLITRSLVHWGWPRSRGLLRTTAYVDAQAWDAAVQGATQACVGLGAGRPRIAVRMLVDVFHGDAWSVEPADDLLDALLQEAAETIKGAGASTPWEALPSNHRMTQHTAEVRWDSLQDPRVFMVLADVSAKGLLWGLAHEREMDRALEHVDSGHTATREHAAGASDEARAAPIQAWGSLEDFYRWCESLVESFEKECPPLPREIPKELQHASLIARRLG